MSEVICPWCKQKGFPDSMQLENGNHQVECDNCDETFGYHVEIEINGIHKVEDTP